MLDEWKEYEEYTRADLFATETSRLNPKFFFSVTKNKDDKDDKDGKATTMNLEFNSAGIRRVLTIIARYHLFHSKETYYPSATDRETRDAYISKIKDNLNEWCFSQNETGLLYQYYLEYISSDKLSEEDIKPFWDDFATKKKKDWNITKIYIPLERENYPQNAITFLEIIADAIWIGPLKTKFLAIKKGFDEDITYQSSRSKKDPASFYKGKRVRKLTITGEKNREYLLKIISSYLLLEQNIPDGLKADYLPLHRTDLANWMAYSSFKDRPGEVPIFFWKEDSLIDLPKKHNSTTPIFRLNSRFLREYDAKLIEKKEIKKYTKEYVIFEDNGAGKNTLTERKE